MKEKVLPDLAGLAVESMPLLRLASVASGSSVTQVGNNSSVRVLWLARPDEAAALHNQ